MGACALSLEDVVRVRFTVTVYTCGVSSILKGRLLEYSAILVQSLGYGYVNV